MKKIFISIIVLFSGFNCVSATDDFLTCPREIPDFSSHDLCKKSQAIELLAGASDREDSAFTEELKDFRTEVLDRIHRDNKSNATFVANKTIFELRQHQECLQAICQKVFLQCSDPSVSKEQNFNQKQWCDSKIDQLIKFQETEIYATAVNNQARKERSLMKQKLVAIEVRAQKYFISLLTNFIRDLKQFEGDITKFVKYPK